MPTLNTVHLTVASGGTLGLIEINECSGSRLQELVLDTSLGMWLAPALLQPRAALPCVVGSCQKASTVTAAFGSVHPREVVAKVAALG